MKKLLSSKVWLACAALAAVLCLCSLAAAEGLPAYQYTGNDPVEAAVVRWMMESGMTDAYNQEEGSVTIPAPVIFRTVEQDDGRLLVYGNFWIYVYEKQEGVLSSISFGENPGIMTLEKQGEGLHAVALETAGEGDDYVENIARFCGGDKELENAYRTNSDEAEEALKEVRVRFAREYVEANGLEIAALQDPYWDPIPLYSEPEPITGSVEKDESYVIRVPVRPGEAGYWTASDDASEGAAVRLVSSGMEDGAFAARYMPAADGAAMVVLRHYTGIACDRVLTWDVKTRDGRFEEVIGGSILYTTSDNEWEALIRGMWTQKDTQFVSMDILRNAVRGWDVTIVSPMTHGAYVFRATMYYDCELNAFVYDNGELFDLPAGGYEGEESLGEPKETGLSGRLETKAADGDRIDLVWIEEADDGREAIAFERAE